MSNRYVTISVQASLSIFPGPLTCSFIISLTIGLVGLGNFGHERIVRVRIGEQRADRKQNLGHGEGRTPLIPENIQTNTPIGIDVGMVNASSEGYLRRLKRVVSWKVNSQEVDAARVRRVRLCDTTTTENKALQIKLLVRLHDIN